MQKPSAIQPKFLNLDNKFEDLKPDESPYIKDLSWDWGANPGSPTGEGSNQFALTPIRANEKIVAAIPLPSGYNLNRGTFYCENTRETYYFNFNGNSNHAIYVIYGDSMLCDTVIMDPELNFSDDQDAFIADHRVRLRVIMNSLGDIVEKYLIFTDGKNWQRFVNVIAAIKTNGFNASLFPYWSLRPPHFDRRELFEFAPRPCMYKPIVSLLPNDPSLVGSLNRVIDKSFQFSTVFQYTDGRTTTFSPWSNPMIVKSEEFQNSPDNLPKRGLLTLYAGSCMVEKMLIYVKQCGGNWALYDTIYKFDSSETNSNNVLGTDYWLRTNPWAKYNYDTNLNTIQYVFDFSKVTTIISQASAIKLQTDMPQLSIGVTDAGNAILLGNNRYDYNNFGSDVMSKLDVSVVEKPNNACLIPTRKIRLYAYIGRPGDRFSWESQVGYFYGDDTQMRFGGMQMGPADRVELGTNGLQESKYFQLDFADRDAFRCYLKGTPYYADGTWYQVNSDNSLTKISGLLDGSNADVLIFMQNVFKAQGYFVCVFDLEVPAGRYIATLGRHNVESTGDYRGTSTYIMGLANSRTKSTVLVPDTTNNPFGVQPLTCIIPNQPNGALVTYIKEQEIDCTSSDVDVWGNGKDLFYVFCPDITTQGNKKYRFVEGYLQESQNSPLPVEMFPYDFNIGADETGQFTDKNGFYFAYTKRANSDVADIQFTAKINCQYPTVFVIPTSQGGIGWKVNPTAYLSDHNSGVVGDCNRVIVNGTVKNLDGTIPYSNIGISIVGGSTVFSKNDGTFTLIIHNGQSTLRVNNIYVNASGNFLITLASCGYLPVFNFNEGLSQCINCQKRTYPLPINLNINIQTFEDTSLKEGGKYSVGICGEDLAGRMMFVNIINDVGVSTFLQRNDTNATIFRMLINSGFSLSQKYPDIKWVSFFVSRDLTKTKYIQWIGDNIKYVDNNGNVVTDQSSAVFCSIAIDSLYNANLAKNFSTLANYQFEIGDRIRILDDGNNNLFDTAQYGDPIDLQILGQTYNQAAITAGLLQNPNTSPVINNQITNTNTVNTTTGSSTTTSVATQQNNQSITLYVPYDARLDKLINDNGFWIEIYTPTQTNDLIPLYETNTFPVINGSIAEFTGFSNGQPVYNYPLSIDLDFWDTYFLSRNITIPKVGSKYFSHPFESPNISDTFGANCSSGGRQHVKNDNAKQQWYPLDTIKGAEFVNQGTLNGLSDFDSTNRKEFREGYTWGGIVAMHTQGSVIIFICENNFFVTNFNFQYIFANAQGVQVANLDNQLSEPMQKIGMGNGCAYEHTGTILFYDKFVFWYDYKNESYILCDYRSSNDISKLMVKSYFKAKTKFITGWNIDKDNSQLFDVMSGVDGELDNIYVTFRPRRNNSNNPLSYINKKRDVSLQSQETLVFNILSQRWTKFTGFTPEAFGTLKGKGSGLQLLSFSAGIPYLHNNGNTFFSTFYGQKITPCLIGVFNENSGIIKVLQNISPDVVGTGYYVDKLYSEEANSFSYIPYNLFKKRENQYYAKVLRNMSSYPNPNNPDDNLIRSTLVDKAGKRVFGRYFICRLVAQDGQSYSELNSVYYLYTNSGNNKK